MELTKQQQEAYFKALDTYLKFFETALASGDFPQVKDYQEPEFYGACLAIQEALNDARYEPARQITSWTLEAAEDAEEVFKTWSAPTVDLYDAAKKESKAREAIEDVRALIDFCLR